MLAFMKMRGTGLLLLLWVGCSTSHPLDDVGTDGGGTDAGPNPTYVIADWQVGCDSVMGACEMPPARSLTGQSTPDAGLTVSCSVVQRDDTRTVTIEGSERADERYGIEVSGARLPRGGGFATGATCRVVVTEGANRFVGACGAAEPSAEQPCQVQVDFDYDDVVMTPTASVRVRCDHLPNEASSEVLRSLTAPTSSPVPAELVFYFCAGLTRD